MKKMILALIVGLSLAQVCIGALRTVTVKDSIDEKMKVIELNDTVIGGKQVADTLSITTYLSDADAEKLAEKRVEEYAEHTSGGTSFEEGIDSLVPIFGIFAIFIMPAIIVLVIIHYRHKSRQAKYQLAEQAIQHGLPVPEGLFRDEKTEREDYNGNRVKGIKNICLGLGLTLFLWLLTDEAFLACIGVIVMLNGVGQLAIYYTGQKRIKTEGTQSKKEEKPKEEPQPVAEEVKPAEG